MLAFPIVSISFGIWLDSCGAVVRIKSISGDFRKRYVCSSSFVRTGPPEDALSFVNFISISQSLSSVLALVLRGFFRVAPALFISSPLLASPMLSYRTRNAVGVISSRLHRTTACPALRWEYGNEVVKRHALDVKRRRPVADRPPAGLRGITLGCVDFGVLAKQSRDLAPPLS